jgi:hypothetical protein
MLIRALITTTDFSLLSSHHATSSHVPNFELPTHVYVKVVVCLKSGTAVRFQSILISRRANDRIVCMGYLRDYCTLPF